MFRSIRFLETVAEFSKEHYRWPRSFTLKSETCGHPGADYDDEARVVTMCYETPFDFAELYRAYVEPPPAAAPAPATKKRRSR
jgi:Putative metallopeptidase